MTSTPPDTSKGVTETRNEEFGFVEFINADVPYIVREIEGHVAILLDMETRAVIGYRVYDPAKATEGIAGLVGRLKAGPMLDDPWTAMNEAAAALTALQAERDAYIQACDLYESDLKRAEAELAAMKEGAAVGKWEIDQSTDNPILTYEKCSVIQDEQAYFAMSAIAAALAHPAPADKGVVEAADVEKLAYRFQNIMAQKLKVDADGDIAGVGPASFAMSRLALGASPAERDGR